MLLIIIFNKDTAFHNLFYEPFSSQSVTTHFEIKLIDRQVEGILQLSNMHEGSHCIIVMKMTQYLFEL